MFDLNHKYSLAYVKVQLRHLASSAKHWNWDATLPMLASLLSILGAIKSGGSERDRILRVILIGSDGYDVIRWSVWLLAGLGVGLLLFAIKRLLGYGVYSSLKYTAVLVCLLVGHFIAGLILTEYKSHIIKHLPARLHSQVEEMRLVSTNRQFNFNDNLADVWDYMQRKMKCCGAEGYTDYGSDSKLLPLTCCVMRESTLSIPQPENLHQCRHDASLRVSSSAFLHVTGCHEPYLTWFMRYTSTITGLLFGSITLQAISLLYLSWQGFVGGHFKDSMS